MQAMAIAGLLLSAVTAMGCYGEGREATPPAEWTRANYSRLCSWTVFLPGCVRPPGHSEF
jgi:hypothetical protein